MRFDRGIAMIKRTRDGRLLNFHGDIFTLPSALAGPNRIVVEFRHALIRIRIDLRSASGGTISNIKLTTTDDIDGVVETAAAWRDFYTLMAWMVSEPMTFELRTRRKKVNPISGTAEPKINLGDARRMERYARGADVVDWVMLRAEAPGTKMRAVELFDAADDLDVLKAIEQAPGEVTPLGFTTACSDALPENFEYDMLYLNRVAMGAVEIAFAARTKMKSQRIGESMNWLSGTFQLAYVRKIKASKGAFAHFADKARRITGIVNWVAPSEAHFDVSAPRPVIDGAARQINR
jgi:hypothetical protein